MYPWPHLDDDGGQQNDHKKTSAVLNDTGPGDLWVSPSDLKNSRTWIQIAFSKQLNPSNLRFLTLGLSFVFGWHMVVPMHQQIVVFPAKNPEWVNANNNVFSHNDLIGILQFQLNRKYSARAT